jgi:hypothetical protein
VHNTDQRATDFFFVFVFARNSPFQAQQPPSKYSGSEQCFAVAWVVLHAFHTTWLFKLDQTKICLVFETKHFQ